MFKMIQASRKTASEEGFSLVELMIVVVIIGILAAIAIPVFANQQKAANDAQLKTDLKTVALWLDSNKIKSGGFGEYQRISYQWKNDASSSPVDMNWPGSSLTVSKGTRVITFDQFTAYVGGSAADTKGQGYCIEGTVDGGTFTPASRLFYSNLKGGITSSCNLDLP